MKIVFICGSLEPGKDGVGDYTRRLAAELIKYGHQAAGVSVNDCALSVEINGVQKMEGIEFPVLRLPYTYAARKSFLLAKEWIYAFNPEWISLQYVPYSFHKKGLPFALAGHLKELGNGRKWHIMFHETWIGADKGANLKVMLTSLLQKFIVKQIIYSLRPDVIHTHLPVYYQRLRKLSWKVNKLPIFSNISVITGPQSNKVNNVFRIGIFSQVKNSESIIIFLSKIGIEATHKGMQIELLIIGGVEEHICKFVNAIGKFESPRYRILVSGFLSEREVSIALQSCTIGITPVPRHALGKSGSVAAFLAHGIPVAAPNIHFRHNAGEIGFFYKEQRSSILMKPDLAELKMANAYAKVAKNQIHESFVAKAFISDLEGRLYE